MQPASPYLYGATDARVTAGNPIGGELMRHFETEVDLEAARETIPEEQSEALEDLIASLRVAGIERQLDAEAWVGADGLVHRVQYTYRLGPTQGGGTTTSTIDFSEFGAEMELNVPDDADVVPIEEAAPPG